MNFVGTGRRLQQGDVGDVARAVGLPTAAILAFIEVEAAGRGFDGANRLKILPERHYLWRLLGPGALRERAVRAGLAYRRWGTKKYPRTSDGKYRLLDRMMDIHRVKALKSTSWALPQILADNHKAAGFDSPEEMIKTMMQGEREQLQALAALLLDWGLVATLKGKDLSKPESWEPAVERYNGPGYKKHNYHGRIAKAFVKHSRGAPMQVPTIKRPTTLRQGVKGEAVRNLQADLATLGFEFKGGIDGRFGPETHAAVEWFQRKHNLIVDGKVGPRTRETLAKAIHLQMSDKSAPSPEWRGQAGGLMALLSAIASLVFSFFRQKG